MAEAGRFLLAKEYGPRYIVEKIFPTEDLAREAASALWCSWVLFHMPLGRAPSELTSGGLGFAHDTIRGHVEASHRPVEHQEAGASAPAAVDDDVVMVGTLELKLLRDGSMTERGDGGGWRVRRIVLHSGSLEWTVGEPDSDGEMQVLLLNPVVSVVKASSDGRSEEDSRCVSICGMIDGAMDTLALRAADSDERDAWLRSVCQCIEQLKALAFDAAVDAVARRLRATAKEHGEAAHQRESTREGVRLLMERFFVPSALQVGTADAASASDEHEELANSLAASLLTRQAEARVRDGERGAMSDDEVRGLQLFSWQPAVSRALEEATWQMVSAWREDDTTKADLSWAAKALDYALGVSQPFPFASAPVAHVDARGVARRLGADDIGPWPRFCEKVHTALIRRVLSLASRPTPPLDDFAAHLEAAYATIDTREDDGEGALLEAKGGATCRVMKRFTSSARALLVEVILPPPVVVPASAAEAEYVAYGDAYDESSAGALPDACWVDVEDATWDPLSAPSPTEEHEEAPTDAPAADAAPVASLERFIFKCGDNLSQDLVTMVLLRQMNVLWHEAGASAFVRTYRVWPTGERTGFIEALPNARPVRDCEFAYSSVLHHSAVGAFTAGFVLGLADRHQDNMLLVGPPHAQVFAHIDFGYVAGARPWFDANLLPVPERFMRCLSAAGRWNAFVDDVAFAFAVLQQERARLCAVAAVFAEPIVCVGYPAYIDHCLTANTPESVRTMAEAAPADLARRFKNLHHKLSHAEGG